jgi:hypothetical protein
MIAGGREAPCTEGLPACAGRCRLLVPPAWRAQDPTRPGVGRPPRAVGNSEHAGPRVAPMAPRRRAPFASSAPDAGRALTPGLVPPPPRGEPHKPEPTLPDTPYPIVAAWPTRPRLLAARGVHSGARREVARHTAGCFRSHTAISGCAVQRTASTAESALPHRLPARSAAAADKDWSD